jgi:hypothetical protein
MKRAALALAAVAIGLGAAPRAQAQGFGGASYKPRPWSRISFFTNSSQIDAPDRPSQTISELSTAFSYKLPDEDENGADYGVDVRYSGYQPTIRPNRVSLYEAFIGAKFADGLGRFRVGHMWVSDLGSLGSVAGGLFEMRSERLLPEDGRFRGGLFAGLEPNILDTGYAQHVKKFGGYFAYDGNGARRHSVGYVRVQHSSLVERSVVTTTNFLPIGRKFFAYQAAEYDVQAPAGQAQRGLTYFFSNVRVVPTDRLEFQGTYNRGRSIDVRSLSEDLLSGRPITRVSLDGLLYESMGGRATVEVIKRLRVYAGYSRDKNNRDAEPTGRSLVGGYASNIAKSGIDVSASDSLMQRPTGSYHSRYVSVGRQFGRGMYMSGDYLTALSLVRFSRSDGVTVETKPQMTRISGTATINVGRSVSVMTTIERTKDDQVRDIRILSGITYRIR